MAKAPLFTPVLIAGCMILMISFAIRASFGVFQIPIAEEFGWLRADFSMAIAIQNLAWGIGQPIFRRVGGTVRRPQGDRHWARCSMRRGWCCRPMPSRPASIRCWKSWWASASRAPALASSWPLSAAPPAPENRSRWRWASPRPSGRPGRCSGRRRPRCCCKLIPGRRVFVIFAAVILSTLLALPFLRAPAWPARQELEEPMGTVLMRAFRDPSYTMIFLGFFSCGYQLGFITAHFPAFITELCGPIDPGGMLAGHRHHHDLGAWGGCHFADRAGQHRRALAGGLAGQALSRRNTCWRRSTPGAPSPRRCSSCCR